MRIAIAIAASLAVAALSGCATRSDATYRALSKVRAPVIPPQALVYTHFSAPLSLDPTSFGSKKGRAVSQQIGLPPLPIFGLLTGLDLFAWGDASQEAAAADGGIKQIEHADYELTVVLYIYRRFETVVYGE